MIESGTLLQNRYLIEKRIGVGGMGAVYLATDQRFNSHVAIKETFYKDKELGEAFEREARLLNSLHHPVLPHVSDFFNESNGYFLVMEYIEGADLAEVLKHEGSFPVEGVLRWTTNLLDALDYLHSQETPIIHRDIKPQNLKITSRGDIILLDFGLAKLKTEDSSGALSVFGYSRKYSPLEQIQGTGTDARSDIFALGATVFHLLTGKPPIDVLARAAEIVAGNPDPLQMANEINPEVPLKVAQILNTALALNAAGRFISAKAMQQALEFAVKGEFSEKTERLPAEITAILPPKNQVITTTSTEDFPALAAFAAETVNDSNGVKQSENEKPLEIEKPLELEKPLEIVIPIAPSEKPKPQVLQKAASESLVPTKVLKKMSQSGFRTAALAALLVCCGLAALYFITKANSSNQPVQTPAAQSIPDLTPLPEQVSDNSISPAPEVPSALVTEDMVEDDAAEKNNPADSIKTSVAKRVAVEKEKPVAETSAPEDEPEKQKPAPVQPESPRRTAPRPRNPAQPNEVVAETVPDIESVFTGRPTLERQGRKNRKSERRRQDESMSEEEWQEFRRQRREARRQRQQNRLPLPF